MREPRRNGLSWRAGAGLLAAALGAAGAGGSESAPVFTPRALPFAADERLVAGEVASGQRVPLRPATWLGRLSLREEGSDFRGQIVPAGEYALCYALQPRLKEHAGVDSHRDFAVLVPSGTGDRRACAADRRAAARSITGTGHAAVLALAPAADASEMRRREPTWRWLAGRAGGLDLALVIEGRARPPEEAF